MLPAGSTYKPLIPEGFKPLNLKGDAPAAGTYIYDPTKITPRTITEAAKAYKHHALLGHIQSKSDLAEAGLPTGVVQASKPDGIVIQDSEVNNPQTAKVQARILQQRHTELPRSIPKATRAGAPSSSR